MSNLIFAKIPAVMRQIGAITKDNKNTSQGYSYRSIDDVYNALHEWLAKEGVFYTTEVLESKREERATKSGGALIYTIQKIKFTFYAEDGSNIASIVEGEAMDSGDKSTNKAMSIALKYALMQIFCIPTIDDKDPDGVSHEVKPAPPSQQIAKKEYRFKNGVSQGKTIEECTNLHDLKKLRQWAETKGYNQWITKIDKRIATLLPEQAEQEFGGKLEEVPSIQVNDIPF